MQQHDCFLTHVRPDALSNSERSSVDNDNLVSTSDGPPLAKPCTLTNPEPIPQPGSGSSIMLLQPGQSQAIPCKLGLFK